MTEKTIQEKAYEVLCRILDVTEKGKQAVIFEDDWGKGTLTIWFSNKFNVESGNHTHIGWPGADEHDVVVSGLHDFLINGQGLSFAQSIEN